MPANHILIPLHDFSAGGTELIAFRLARRWLASGRRVSILAGASDGPLRERVPNGAEVHILGPQRPRSATSRLFLGRQMAPAARAIAPDAIFIPGNFHFMLGKGLRAALPHAAIIAKASNPVWSDDWVPLPLARTAVALGTRGIERIVAMSAALAPEVARFVDGARVVTIDDPFLDDDTAIAARASVRTSSMPLKLLTVARLEPQKDPELAIATVKALRNRGQDVKLDILGSGPMMQSLSSLLDMDSDLEPHVNIVGYIADPSPYYRSADMLLMSSRFEGVPAVIGEALIHGMPFVATDCSTWLTDLARNHPALGSVAATRSPEALADAIIERGNRAPPTRPQIEAGIGRHRAGPAAQSYLDLFDSLV